MTVLQAGAEVLVRDDWPERHGPVHVRTPHYLRGRRGRVVRALGVFADPGALAFGRAAAQRRLYHVAFALDAIWDEGGEDEIVVEIYEHWLVGA